MRPQPPQAVTVPVEQLAADLRRLAAYLETVYDTEQPAKMERVTAAALAYDWVLVSACRTLEVSEGETAPCHRWTRSNGSPSRRPSPDTV